MEMHQVRYFLAAATELNFTKAAEKCNVSQPALTRAIKLLEGEPAVLRLLKYNPFPQAPPKYVRARIYLYEFTRFGEKGWWRRQDRGMYFPAVSLK